MTIKQALYLIAAISFASTYPMAPLFRAGQRVRQTATQSQFVPLLNKNIGYQSRQFFEPTTIAATAVGATAGAYGLKKFYDSFLNFRNQRSITQAKSMAIHPEAYTSQNIKEIIKTIKNMPGYQRPDIAGNWYSLQNRELLNTLALAKLEKKYQDINFNLTPESWINYFEPSQLLEDIVYANRYTAYGIHEGNNTFIIPPSIAKGLVIIKNNKDLRYAFINKMNATRKSIALSESSMLYHAFLLTKAERLVLAKIDEILGTEE